MKVGSLVVAIKSFEELKRIWGFPYPNKGDILTISEIEKHPIHNFNLLRFEELQTVPLCHESFREIIIPLNILEEIEDMKENLNVKLIGHESIYTKRG